MISTSSDIVKTQTSYVVPEYGKKNIDDLVENIEGLPKDEERYKYKYLSAIPQNKEDLDMAKSEYIKQNREIQDLIIQYKELKGKKELCELQNHDNKFYLETKERELDIKSFEVNNRKQYLDYLDMFLNDKTSGKLIEPYQLVKLCKQNLESYNTFANEPYKVFGIGTSQDQMFEKGNMLIVKIGTKIFRTLDPEYKKMIQRKIQVCCIRQSLVGKILKAACQFWVINPKYFILVNQDGVTINPKSSIEELFLNNPNESNVIELILIHKYSNNNFLLYQLKAITNKTITGDINNQQIEKDYETFKEVMVDRRIEKSKNMDFKTFFEMFPKLADYIDVNNLLYDNISKRDKKRLSEELKNTPKLAFRINQTVHFYLMVIFIITNWIILSYFPTEDLYNYRQDLLKLFSIEKTDRFHILEDVKPVYFVDIKKGTDFRTWLVESSDMIYKNSIEYLSKTFFNSKSFWMWQPIIIAYKTKVETCKIPNDFMTCYYSNYTPNTRREETFTKISFDHNEELNTKELHQVKWKNFCSSSQSGIDYTIKGYDGSGYIWGLGLQLDSSEIVQASIANNLNQLEKEFFHTGTQAVSYLLGGYLLDIDYFFSINLALERNESGTFYPLLTDVSVFKPNISWNCRPIFVIAILQIFIIVGLISLLITNIISYLRSKKFCRRIINLSILTSIVIVVFEILFQFFFWYGFIKFSKLDFFKDPHEISIEPNSKNKYIDVRHMSDDFHTTQRVKAISLGTTIITICLILLSKLIKKEFYTMITKKIILKNFLYFIPFSFLIIGLSLGFRPFLIDTSKDYINFYTSILATSLLFMGRFEVLKKDAINDQFLTMVYLSISLYMFVSMIFAIYYASSLKEFYNTCRTYGTSSSILAEYTCSDIQEFQIPNSTKMFQDDQVVNKENINNPKGKETIKKME